jgi:hypothetical protein
LSRKNWAQLWAFLAQLRAGPKTEPKGPNFWSENRLNFKSFDSNYGQAKYFDLTQIWAENQAQLWARPKFELIYLKYQLHEFIVKFNIKKCKGSSIYDVTFLRRESILEILTSYVEKENRKIVSSYVDDPFKNFILNFTINSCSWYFKYSKNLMNEINTKIIENRKFSSRRWSQYWAWTQSWDQKSAQTGPLSQAQFWAWALSRNQKSEILAWA